MFRFAIASAGLIGLSVASGFMLFASHEALASGPRLPLIVKEAPQLVAAQSAQKAQVQQARALPAESITLVAPAIALDADVRDDTPVVLALATIKPQSHSFLAPDLAPRPQARPVAWKWLKRRHDENEQVSSHASSPYYVPAKPRSAAPKHGKHRAGQGTYRSYSQPAAKPKRRYFRPENLIGVFQ